ncbi:FkbM family methyltransferase [Variovorax soli]|uniref:FkbM family methyltransferase n=1 Tax=Variovorax soli TaxID=376815 RepID=A0ABU1NBY4_9BURK|nr:FkbM family methyltransferase [Variovorax soli]MDR6535959.1 FkbM family methyltransferase [Variovorax soli]
MQTRLQSAIDQSSIPARLDASDRAHAARFDAIDRQGAAMRASLESGEELSALRFESLRVAIDALRRDQAETVSRIEAAAERVSDALAGVSAASSEGATAGALLSRVDTLLQRLSLPLGNEVMLQTPDGFLLVPAEDRTLLAAVWESGGRLEPGTIKVMKALLREGDYVVDVGAHIGLTVLPAARKVGPHGRVLAIEPGSRVASLLRQSIALNFLGDRVVVEQCAAGDQPGTARLHLSDILGESSLLSLPTTREAEDVEVKTVDALVAPQQPVRLVKIDAEGFEPHVWRGMRRVVDENPELLLLVEFGPIHLQRAGVSVEAWLSGFNAAGFTPHEIDEMSGEIRPLRPAAALGSVASLNLLMLRRPLEMYPELLLE